ncbi:MAG: response regulator, partial [Candidatus Hodarchaeales archaeon]
MALIRLERAKRDVNMSRILLVDNDPDFLAMAQTFLAEAYPPFEIQTVMSAHTAIALLQEDPVDAIVCDYQMPEMNGLEFLEELRKGDDKTPFVMFTGQGREEVAMQALNLGADYYLKKGGDPESQYGELTHIIRQLIQHKRTDEAHDKLQKSYDQLERELRIFERKTDSFFEERWKLFIAMGILALIWGGASLFLVIIEGNWNFFHYSPLNLIIDTLFAILLIGLIFR